ncbi:MAG: hypothetical protein H6843_14100 [Rhodospirillaceae bacterium]|nr:hypothetical protein [Rhodospirillaceae bacterium]
MERLRTGWLALTGKCAPADGGAKPACCPEDATPTPVAEQLAAYCAAMFKAPDPSATEKQLAALQPIDKSEGKTQHTKGVYEDHWGKRIDGLRARIKAGESIGYLLRTLRPYPHGTSQRNRVSGAVTDHFLKDFPLLHGTRGFTGRIEVVNGRYQIANNVDPITILHQETAKVTNIVELGSGPGWNLFDLFVLRGAGGRPVQYFGLEYTDAGIECASLLQGLCPGMSLTSRQFDFTKPDVSMVPDNGPTVFFSHHAIEQVEDISPDLYEQLLRRKTPWSILHFEPVGWQRYEPLLRARLSEDLSQHRALASGRLSAMGSDFAVPLNAAINSWRVGYNRNLLPILAGLVDAGRLALVDAIYDFTSRLNVNPVNPTTYVRLQSAGR